MRRLSLALAVLTLASTAHAQSTWRSEYTRSMATVESKFMALASATPWDKYSYTPGKGVRTTCEVFMHITLENYQLMEPLGTPIPASVDQKNMEKCPASKDATIAAMKASFEFARNAVAKTADADAEKMVKLFGSDVTKRGLLLATAEHAGEHLGQLIAYSRVNGITPPWTK